MEGGENWSVEDVVNDFVQMKPEKMTDLFTWETRRLCDTVIADYV